MRYFLFFLLFSCLVKAQDVQLNLDVSKKQRGAPSFPGGEDSLKHYLSRNTVFPKEYLNNEKFTECNVSVKFKVEENGELKDIKINKGCFGFDRCDLEALRLVKAMPKWVPAKVDGIVVPRGFSINIPFIKPKNP